MAIRTEEELGKALSQNQDSIIIEGDLKHRVIRIKGTGKPAWILAFAVLVVIIVIVISTGGGGTPIAGVLSGAVVGILGAPAALSAVQIGVAARSAESLNDLRRYTIIENSPERLVLKRNF